MDKIKKTKGITLIALVITIIVLLILAGITINLTIGQNGILTQAQNAGEEHSTSAVKEKVEIMLLDYLSDKYLNDKKILEYLKEQKEIDNVIDNGDGTITIQIDGYNVIIDDKNLTIIEINSSFLCPEVSNIKITLEDGITEPEKYSIAYGTKLKISFDAIMPGGIITSIQPDIPYITNGMETEKEFIIKGQVDGEEYEKIINVSFDEKYKIQNPEIVLSESKWTNNNIIVSVNWFNNSNDLKKEISLDNGITYFEYVQPIEISTNVVVKAKISNDTMEIVEEVEIDNIDKLEPNEFTPVISDLISSTEITVNAGTTDKEATEEYGKSEIEGYKYYVYKDGTLLMKSELITDTSWKVANLIVENTYDIYVEAYDNAGNCKKSEIVSHKKLNVYEWDKYSAKSETKYTHTETQKDEVRINYTTKIYTTTGTMNNTSQYWACISKGKAGDVATSSISGLWVATSSNATTIYKGTYTKEVDEKSPVVYDLVIKNATIRKKESYVEYSRGTTKHGTVMGNDINAYPENGYQSGYWYVRK